MVRCLYFINEEPVSFFPCGGSFDEQNLYLNFKINFILLVVYVYRLHATSSDGLAIIKRKQWKSLFWLIAKNLRYLFIDIKKYFDLILCFFFYFILWRQ